MYTIRPAEDADMAAIAAIYSHYVLTSTCSFETVPPTPQDMAARRAEVLSRGLPWLVAQDPDGSLRVWAQQFVLQGGATGTRELLVAMTQFIRDTLHYQARFDQGVQTPYDSLRLQSGTCRDFATLMIEAIRHLGYAARFVSGYLYTPLLDSGTARGGSTHAWLQVYLPGAGWIPFDPTNNLVGGKDRDNKPPRR